MANRIVFVNTEAAKRILDNVVVLRIWFMNKDCVCVRVRQKGHIQNRILSIKMFLEDAKKIREEKAKKISCVLFPGANWFITRTPGSGRPAYNTSKKRCSCPDWQNQNAIGNGFGVPVCAHQVAIANYLGFGSFKEYKLSKVA